MGVGDQVTKRRSAKKGSPSHKGKGEEKPEESTIHREEDVAEFKRENKPEDKLAPVHHSSPSLFSSASDFQNYRGVINLCILLLILSNFRVALDNVLKYGVLVDPKVLLIFLEDPYRWPCASLVLGSNIFIQFAFWTEKLLQWRTISENIGCAFHVLNSVAVLVVPVVVVLAFNPRPWWSTIALFWYTACWVKLISYAMVNAWCREEQNSLKKRDDNASANRKEEKDLVKYPSNLNQTDLYYYMLAPTFCYELNFPRSPKIRIRFLLRRIAEYLFLSGLMLALGQQWMVPTIKNSLKPFQELDFLRCLERIMKLAVPNHLMWLLFFYGFFHSFFNILAEILRFGDRTFYKDWWNSNTVEYFWQNWNIPIHRWCHRHLYRPMLRYGYKRSTAAITVFLLSAFFHELLVSVPLRMLRIWAFLGMLLQLPFSVFVSKYLSGNYGNAGVWLSLILGQPVVIMMYYHDYYVTYLLTET